MSKSTVLMTANVGVLAIPEITMLSSKTTSFSIAAILFSSIAAMASAALRASFASNAIGINAQHWVSQKLSGSAVCSFLTKSSEKVYEQTFIQNNFFSRVLRHCYFTPASPDNVEVCE